MFDDNKTCHDYVPLSAARSPASPVLSSDSSFASPHLSNVTNSISSSVPDTEKIAHELLCALP